MAKKKSAFKDILKEFGTKTLEILVASIDTVNIVKWIQNISGIKEKIRKCIISAVVAIAGLAVLLLGVASFLASKFPVLGNGISELIVGVVVLIAATIYAKV
jgi:hypothetical protein